MSDRRQRLADLLADCHDDPGLFHEAILGRLPLHGRQEEIARSVCTNRVTVVPAAHAVGKSWYAATAALHWLFTRPGSKVVTTSASNNQLVSVLWAAIKNAHSGSRIPLAGAISDGHAIPQRLELGPEWYAMGWSAKKPESFSGVHGGEILVIVDEASGVEQPIWDAIESLGYSSLLALGNPIRSGGHFRALFEQARAGAPGYAAYHLSAFDSPYAKLTDEDVKARGLPRGLATASWIERIRRLFGEGSLYWRTRVLALFPEQDHDQLFPQAWVDRCVLVRRAGGNSVPCVIVDISKGTGRDRTVVLAADYLGLREVHGSNQVGVQEAAVLAVQVAQRHGVRPENVIYDAGGWAGSDMRRYLDQFGYHGATPYYGSGGTSGRYRNLRSRCAWRLRQRLDPERPTRVRLRRVDPYQPPRSQPAPEPIEIQPPFHIPAGLQGWEEMREELLELRYRHDGPRLELEKKENMAQRLGRSPDLADVMIMLASAWPDDD